jgi:3D (Asp-Asp-Asp) domain-containing protein
MLVSLRKFGVGFFLFAAGSISGAVAVASSADAHGARAQPARSSYRLGMTATAYCLRGRTASGTAVAPGTVAVDPRFIRLGSRLRVSGYGAGRALDTGSAIRGSIIDVWFASCARAMQWGRRPVVVTVYR